MDKSLKLIHEIIHVSVNGGAKNEREWDLRSYREGLKKSTAQVEI